MLMLAGAHRLPRQLTLPSHSSVLLLPDAKATNRPFLHLRDDSGQAQDKGDAADSKSCGAEK